MAGTDLKWQPQNKPENARNGLEMAAPEPPPPR